MKMFFYAVLLCHFGSLLSEEQQLSIQEKLFLLDGRQTYIAWRPPLKGTSDKRVRVLLAIHGSGREAVSYKPDHPASVPFYVHQRDLALEAGYIFVAISNGADTWGTDKGMHALLKVYDHIQNEFRAESQWVVWASSAGGVLAHRLVKEHAEKVRKVLGTFPVYDLGQSFDRLASARKAWGNREAADLHNPANTPQALRSVPYLVFHGSADEAVPAGLHSERLCREVNEAGGNVRLHLVSGGHSTANFALYDDPVIKAFLAE